MERREPHDSHAESERQPPQRQSQSSLKYWKLMIMETVGILALLYILLAPRVAMPLYNKLIFYPLPAGSAWYPVEEVCGIKPEEILITLPTEEKIHAWRFTLPGAAKTVVVSHGNAGNLSYRWPLCALVLRAGASVLVYDYRGYGKSTGSPSLEAILEDGLAVHNWLVSHGTPPEQIIHLGESLGSLVACHISSRHECGGLILQSGLASLRRIAHETLPYLRLYPDWLMPAQQPSNVDVLRRSHPPLLLVHGRQDSIIPIGHSEEMFLRASEPKTFVRLPDADHNDIYEVNSDLYLDALKEFLRIRGTNLK